MTYLQDPMVLNRSHRLTEKPLVHIGFLSQLPLLLVISSIMRLLVVCCQSISQQQSRCLAPSRGRFTGVCPESLGLTQIKLSGQRSHWCEGRETEGCCPHAKTCGTMLAAWTEPREQLKRHFRDRHTR